MPHSQSNSLHLASKSASYWLSVRPVILVPWKLVDMDALGTDAVK
jgi:hypothetical protein